MFNSHTTRNRHLKQACARALADTGKAGSVFTKGNHIEKRRALNEIARKVAAMQAPQYYVDQIYAYNVLSAHFAGGHPLPARGLVKQKWQEITRHVLTRRRLKPDEPLIDSIAYVLAYRKASGFFLSTACIRRFIKDYLNSVAI